ncbi:hypothetical protein [Catenovulum maritimum]|uniref:Porin domain-containing protein n=1 Tax=Catenovulum maritimum TaxID=1513271 RepID=A0A0J8GQK6_9ALTE|nr:hypothetical protein [Catenovulum maritimum]KMT65065.1 hypothetical protein XM47_11390 [Catenovulum maritimum]
MNKFIKLAIATCIIFSHSSNLYARDKLDIKGFLTIAGYHSSNDNLGFQPHLSSSDVGYKGDDEYLTLSKVGLQLNYQLSTQFELVGQIVAQKEVVVDNSDRIKIATLNYSPTSSLLFRIGRFAPRTYLLSDSRLIGYSNNEVIPNHDFYAQLPLSYVNGADLTYNFGLSDGVGTASIFTGRTEVNINATDGNTLNSKFKNLLGFNLEYQTNNWLYRFGYTQSQLANSWEQVDTAIQFLTLVSQDYPSPLVSWTEGKEFVEAYRVKDKWFRYKTLAVQYDNSIWRVRAEIGDLAADSSNIPKNKNAYVSFSRTFDQFTPFLTLSAIKTSSPRTFSKPDEGLVQFLSAQSNQNLAFGLQQVFQFAETSAYNQKSISLGVRYDFALRQDIKLQFERKHVEAIGSNLWVVKDFSKIKDEYVSLIMFSYDRVF